MPSREEQRTDHDRRRGSARSRGYDGRWDRAAAAYRAAHPLCVGCLAIGRVSPSALVDHVVPHKGDSGLFWDQDNWQAACRWHHDVIKKRLEALFVAGRIGIADLRLDSATARRLAAAPGVGGV